MILILAIVWVPRWFHAYGIFFLRRSQYVGCTQYMATRTAILDVKIVLNQCLEEIAKREAPVKSLGEPEEISPEGRLGQTAGAATVTATSMASAAGMTPTPRPPTPTPVSSAKDPAKKRGCVSWATR